MTRRRSVLPSPPTETPKEANGNGRFDGNKQTANGNDPLSRGLTTVVPYQLRGPRRSRRPEANADLVSSNALFYAHLKTDIISRSRKRKLGSCSSRRLVLRRATGSSSSWPMKQR